MPPAAVTSPPPHRAFEGSRSVSTELWAASVATWLSRRECLRKSSTCLPRPCKDSSSISLGPGLASWSEGGGVAGVTSVTRAPPTSEEVWPSTVVSCGCGRGTAVAACTRWLIGAEVSTNASVTRSTTESATSRSSSQSFAHKLSAVRSNFALCEGSVLCCEPCMAD